MRVPRRWIRGAKRSLLQIVFQELLGVRIVFAFQNPANGSVILDAGILRREGFSLLRDNQQLIALPPMHKIIADIEDATRRFRFALQSFSVFHIRPG